ncbi:hypothetical protein CHARACLAT_022324 [Characodon lateralis]|uniref:Uncharacterized protein n=1 Tax=Characodon lateralis TaxID=208331 RepID=A0ABU7CQC9_9TELE|nr:hypothetical protein [Characodon lateralis]
MHFGNLMGKWGMFPDSSGLQVVTMIQLSSDDLITFYHPLKQLVLAANYTLNHRDWTTAVIKESNCQCQHKICRCPVIRAFLQPLSPFHCAPLSLPFQVKTVGY